MFNSHNKQITNNYLRDIWELSLNYILSKYMSYEVYNLKFYNYRSIVDNTMPIEMLYIIFNLYSFHKLWDFIVEGPFGACSCASDVHPFVPDKRCEGRS